ncbi:hypothetical protein CR164_12250 [Prosthecochloris marina]|uniref:Transcriptional regulator HTH-type FeoC domain-containing protein n=2 Tax=Prosthecochloris marina TaxID=2017681 RepID=A0A317T6G0_9CHLB|nr:MULTISPECIES: FeoC-like transcriptional regulator [unclassified Prosthecochloris]PWW81066.1 hypothetical protein CR164_12250 [Prosthecochloris marina]UZJ39851.1 FeoC-like transcriptional regulator [Prosthecochloris sp. SCSIO W1102]
MSLLELKEYLQNRGIVSINDLSVHYNASPETLEPMLEHWIRKGKLRKETPDSSCGNKKSSCSCCTGNDVWYQWIQ